MRKGAKKLSLPRRLKETFSSGEKAILQSEVLAHVLKVDFWDIDEMS